jgi:hypothetical protein
LAKKSNLYLFQESIESLNGRVTDRLDKTYDADLRSALDRNVPLYQMPAAHAAKLDPLITLRD